MQAEINTALINEVRREMFESVIGFNFMSHQDRENLVDVITKDLLKIREKEAAASASNDASIFGKTELSVQDYILVRYSHPVFTYNSFALIHESLSNMTPLSSAGIFNSLSTLSIKDWNSLSEVKKKDISRNIREQLIAVLKTIEDDDFKNIKKSDLLKSTANLMQTIISICSALNINVVTFLNNFCLKQD